MRAALLLPQPLAQYVTGRVWLQQLQRRCCRALQLDRHYLAALEDVCIGATELGGGGGEYAACPAALTVDGLRAALVRLCGAEAEPRELPAALLRLYFADKHHYARLLERVPLAAFRRLCALMQQDAEPVIAHDAPLPLGEERTATWSSDGAERARLHRYLARILDAALCSFERCLCAMARAYDAGERWPLMGLEEALRDDPYWANVASQPLCAKTRLVQLCWLWRCHVALQLQQLVQPWLGPQQRDWLLYQLQLYRDTHLDLSAAQQAHQAWDDAAPGLLALHWPAADRVCCFDELPDLAEHALDNHKTGVYLKERSTLGEKLAHVFFNKTANNICKERNFRRIVVRYGEQDEIVYDLVKLVTRCVLLGNVPGARGTLCWAARVRLTCSMWGEQADSVLQEQELKDFLPAYCHPQTALAQKRQRKAAAERKRGATQERIDAAVAQCQVERDAATRFKMWMLKCPYCDSSQLKEYMLATQERLWCQDALLSLDIKWLQYKQMVRLINGGVRQALSQQCGARDWAQPLDWSQLESIERVPQRDYSVKRGYVMECHTQGLHTNVKVFKRPFAGIIDVKATGIEEGLAGLQQKQQHDDATVVQGVCSDGTPSTAHRPTLEQLHFVCWCMAARASESERREGLGHSGAVLETRWFQVLGMTRDGLRDLREWLFKYHTYDVADDSFKKEIRAFQQRSMNDYLLMKTVFKLVAYYRRKEQHFHLPSPMALRQLHALRSKQMRLCAWEPTPPLLGVSYQCQGCLRFANAVVPPLDYPALSCYCELMRADLQVYAGDDVARRELSGVQQHNVALVTRDRHWRVVERYQSQLAQRQERRQQDETRWLEELATEERRRRRENISFLNVAFYNAQDGAPYCVRNRRQRHQTEPTGQQQLVMRSLHNGTRITAHTLRVTNNSAPQSTTATQRQRRAADASESDEESYGEEEAVTEGDTQELRAHYEGLALAFNPSTRNLRREAGQRMAQLSSLTLGAPSTTAAAPTPPASLASNNKKRILQAVQQPLHQVYSCQAPMLPVDMVGLVKNGRALCVECGVMTELTSHSMTWRGPNCMRHADASLTRAHPAWEVDTAGAAHVAPQDRLAQRPHPDDLVQDERPCQGCRGGGTAVVWLPCMGTRLRLRRVACCRACYRRVKTPLQRQCWVTEAQLFVVAK